MPYKDEEEKKRYMKEYQRKFYLFRNHGLTNEEYERMLKEQNNLCAICEERSEKRKLDVDHDHLTGKIRGLLCNKCNQALGLFQDSTDLLEVAVRYLDRNGPVWLTRVEKEPDVYEIPPANSKVEHSVERTYEKV